MTCNELLALLQALPEELRALPVGRRDREYGWREIGAVATETIQVWLEPEDDYQDRNVATLETLEL